MDPNVVYQGVAECGCSKTETYNDDPNFSGYDTDRTDFDCTTCADHKSQIRSLEDEIRELHVNLNEKNKQLKELNFSVEGS